VTLLLSVQSVSVMSGAPLHEPGGAMGTGRQYTNPDAAGYLLEADACKKVVAELRRIAEKYQRKIDREQAARKAELEAAMEYRSERDIQDAYGWEFITEKQYDLYLEIFRNGQAALENRMPTVNELAHKILLRILSDIDAEQREWRFSALTPAQQREELQRAEQAKREWKEKIHQIKERLGVAATLQDTA